MEQLSDHLLNSQLTPEPFKDDGGADRLCLTLDLALPGKDQQSFLAKTGKGADEGLDLAFGTQFVHTPNGCNHALGNLGVNPPVSTICR